MIPVFCVMYIVVAILEVKDKAWIWEKTAQTSAKISAIKDCPSHNKHNRILYKAVEY